MIKQDKKKFTELLTTFSEIFNRKLSELTYQAYWETLKDLDLTVITKNATNHMKTSKFFPTPAELRNDPEKKDTTILAWQKVLKAIKVIGQYSTPDFQVAGINETIDLMGGWIKLCTGKEEDLKWQFKEFEKIFSVMSKKESSTVQLVGIHELHNRAKGFETEAPILIKAPEQEKLLKGEG